MTESGLWFVYVLLCENGTLYRGYTNDLEARFAKHVAGKGAKYTRMHKPVKIIYHEEFETKIEAIRRERYFKTKEGNVWLRERMGGLT